jgi:hypothetical protein
MTRIHLAALIAAATIMGTVPTQGAMILPGIRGTVYQDVNADGTPSSGEGINGATLRLYQDDGDGLFEPGAGDSQVGPDFVTGTDGSYLFQTLDPNAGYFVQSVQMQLGGTFLPGSVSQRLSPSQISLMIDAFDNNQEIKTNPKILTATSTLNDPMSGVLGRERDLYVHLLKGVGDVKLRSNAFGVAVLQYDTTAGVIGEGVITWDGVDSSASPVPSLGLGNLDLTNAGSDEGLLLRLGVDSTGAGEMVRIRIFDQSQTEYSEAQLHLPATDGSASEAVYVPFSEFQGNVSPSRVNAIQLLLGNGAMSIDAQIDVVGTIGPQVHNFLAVPEPGSLGLGLLASFGLLLGARRRSPARV